MKNTTLANIAAAMNLNTVAFNEVCAYTTDSALRMSVAIKAVAEDGNEALIGRLYRYACIGDDGNEAVYLTEMAMVMVIDGVTYEAAGVLPVEIEALLDMEEFSHTGVWEDVDLPLANNTSSKKEENTMMNMTVKKLRGMAKELGISGYSKMNKINLVAAIQFFMDEERKAKEAVAPTVVEEKIMKFLKAVAKEIMFQTLPSKDGELIIQKDEKGELVLREFALFYKATRTDCKEYMTLGRRLWAVVSKVIGNLYGESNKTSEVIQKAIDKMVEYELVTKVAAERTYATLSPATMSQDEKDQLNGLWKTKDIKVEKTKTEGYVRVTAITDNGKAALNQLYPCWTYRATSAQMNTLYKLSK